jgi:adenylate cyclase
MQCLSCRAENDAQNAFCEACGVSLHLICGACGRTNGRNSRFCGHCGALLDSAASPPLNSNQLLRALSVSGGEYKRLTVLFADIRNSTSLIDSLGDPELAMRRLEPVLALMKEAVHRYDGIVNKVQGDGVMALFGAPKPHEDHAVRGCLAALAMQDAVAKLGDPGVQIRVGLNTGEVVVQVVENSIYQTYDAAGVNVHLANRMEQMADEGSILITAHTYAAARQFVEVAPLGIQAVRGISTPVEVFKLTGLLNAPASGVFRSEKRLTSLIGRSDELAALELEFTHAVNGDGRVIGIVGEAGLGKSRICFEFAEACRRRSIRVQEARVLSHGRATPFQPVLELLRDVLSIRPNDKAEVSRQRVTAQLRKRGNFSESLPLVLDFLGLQDAAQPPSKQDATARKHQLLAFVRQLIRSRPADETVLVVVEDLHWIDQASDEFVDAMVDAVVGTKTLLLLNFRPGYTAPWMQRSHYRQIALEPLAVTDSGELLKGLLGDDPSLALLARNIVERAQGNPFFLEELVHSLAERGDFEGEHGAYLLKAGIDEVPLPPNVQAVLSARIDQLEESSRQILQTAAVIGREVPLPILQRVAGLSADQVAEALRQLRRAELLYELPRPSPGDHAFRHPLIQEVAYRSLLQGRRSGLHREVANALENEFAARLDEYSALVAFHLEQAGDLLPAVQALARSAMWIGAKDPSQAMRSWVKARELLIVQPRSEKADFLRMMACGQIVSFGWREGLPAEEAKPLFEEADGIAQEMKNKRASSLLHAGFGRILAVGGSADDYVAKVKEALALAREAHDSGLEAMLKGGLAQALRYSGRLNEALEANIEATGRAHELSDWDRKVLGFDIEPWLTAMRGQLLIMLGRSDEARAFLDRVIQMDPNDINVSDHVVPSLSYVDLAWVEHDVHLAEQHAERAFSLAVRSGNPYLRTYATACRGLAHIVAGRAGAAIEDLTAAIDFARRRKAGLEYEPKMLADLANAYLLKGDLGTALRAADEAIAVCVARHARATEALARIIRAQALLASGAEGVEGELGRAKALVAATGAKIYEPLIDDLGASLADPGETPSRRTGVRRSSAASTKATD